MALALTLAPLADSGSLVLAQKAYFSSFMLFTLALVLGSVDLPLTGSFGFGSGLTALALLLMLFYFWLPLFSYTFGSWTKPWFWFL